jgi:cysteine desulfurase family protein
VIYFDNAATTGTKPNEVIAAVEKALKERSVNPGRGGYKESVKCSEEIYECRKNVSDFFGAGAPERVVFTSNCTSALNMIIKGICNKGNKVVCSSLEHNAVARPIHKMTKLGVILDTAEVIFGDRAATVRSFERLITPETRLVVCTHASNVTGTVLPIKEIGEICAERGVPFAVDAAQTAGILNINMRELKIDYLAVAPHKGLYAPMGTGILISLGKIPDTLFEGGTGSLSASYEQPLELPDRLESGTLNVSGIAGIKAGIDFVSRQGVEKIYSHELKLIQYIYDQLSKINGVILYTERPEMNNFVPTLSFNVRGLLAEQVAEILSDKGIAVRAGLHCAPMAHRRLGTIDSGTVRICCSLYNTKQDADILLETVKKINFNSKN